ncbi:hypothetical protein CXB51_026003 [Gossypium anomalum]|uniref:Uncharacterized protein n=1 Tax=Gossypium anomalum TaxID=47600 RepID=A0A8J5YRQ6_9ROSI|nr:hypothetical protein CXB51_026003 [Gossypium anomalum]
MGCKMIPMLSILALLLSLSLLLLASSTTSTRVGKMGNREIRRNLIYGGPKEDMLIQAVVMYAEVLLVAATDSIGKKTSCF